MMDLWWRAAGYARIRLTSADWPARLCYLTGQGIRLDKIRAKDDLTVEFSVRGTEAGNAVELLAERGDTAELLGRGGLTRRLRAWVRYPVIILTLVLITAATLWLPGRILHIRVEGNGNVPARLILEAAADSGVHFGAARREIRSERVKNALLERIPQLRWVGVNSSGCQAIISVRVRDESGEVAEGGYHSAMVAARNAVVTDVTVTGGTGLCVPGQTVRAGQVLISGYSDLGIATRAEPAAGEVWGMTARSVTAVVPDSVLRTEPTGEIVEKYSLLLGKKRINFHSDSGILYETCGKMREVIWLTLPGGWELPVALVVERYCLTRDTAGSRTDAEGLLAETAERAVRSDMIAGEIRGGSQDAARTGALWVLRADFECHEMIGRLRPGAYLEGDMYDDRENGERRAG